MRSEHVHAAALASLPLVGPHRLRALIDGCGPVAAWHVLRGEAVAPPYLAAVMARDDLGRIWRAAATDELLGRVAGSLDEHDIRVLLHDDPQYPAVLRADGAAPAVLFARGDPTVCANRRVGIVGTRAATAAGRHFAHRLAHELSLHGVAVVSGLARGIDGAAHSGVVAGTQPGAAHSGVVAGTPAPGPPIGVVASGLDVVYPREHRDLWQLVAERGVLFSESPPGCAPEAFRFPLRNRILAALSEVLVVVESRAAGGSMITVEEALKRDVTVMAVPGSPQNERSAGCNLLISQGAATVCDATDVLVALGLDHSRFDHSCLDQSRHTSTRDTRATPAPCDVAVLDALRRRPCTLSEVVEAVNLPITSVALSLGRLEAQGWVVANGGWWEALIVA